MGPYLKWLHYGPVVFFLTQPVLRSVLSHCWVGLLVSKHSLGGRSWADPKDREVPDARAGSHLPCFPPLTLGTDCRSENHPDLCTELTLCIEHCHTLRVLTLPLCRRPCNQQRQMWASTEDEHVSRTLDFCKAPR